MKTDIGYIYVLSLKSDEEIRYVGQTLCPKNRLRQHLQERGKNKGLPVNRWILKHNKEIQMEVVEICSLDKLDETEDFYINYFKSLDFSLLNLVPGGYSTRGYKYTPEQKKQTSEATRRSFESKERRIKQSRALGGKPIRDHLGNYYESAQEAARELGINSRNLRAVLYGKQLTCEGHTFAYADQPIPKLLTKEEVHKLRVQKQREGKSPTAPVMLQDQFGNVYQSLKEAASKHDISTYVLKSKVRKKQPVNGFMFTRK